MSSRIGLRRVTIGSGRWSHDSERDRLLLCERHAGQGLRLAVLDRPGPHRCRAGCPCGSSPRAGACRPGVTKPLILVSSAVLIAGRVSPPLSIAALNAHSAVAVSTSKFETGRSSIFCSSAACARTGFVFGRNAQTVPRYELMIAPLTSRAVPGRNCGEMFAPVSTSCCGSWSCLNCLTIVAPAGVAVQSQSACAPESFTFVSSAEKSVDAGREDRRVDDLEPVLARELRDLRRAVAPEAAVVAHQPDLLDPQLAKVRGLVVRVQA